MNRSLRTGPRIYSAEMMRTSLPGMITPIPLGLYAHIPWCERKCPYCDFNSHEFSGNLPQTEYIDTLLRDLESEWQRQPDPEIQSVFIGGGTPSLFQPAQIARLLSGVAERTALATGAEVVLEANPGALEVSRLPALRRAGVTRLSLGVQSFDDASLQALGRIHSAADARAAIVGARAAGFDSFNLDLMYGLPHQLPRQALGDLRAALDCEPPHLSWYQLTLEPNTRFYSAPPPLPTPDAIADIEAAGAELLIARGYQRYEVSAWAQPGRDCVHNRNYWEFGDYLGIGAGAHGKRSTPSGEVERTRKLRNPASYLSAAAPTVERKLVPAAELPLEFMLNVLRLPAGVSTEWFEDRTGLPLSSIAGMMAEGRARGLLDTDLARIAPTPRGLLFLQDTLALFTA